MGREKGKLAVKQSGGNMVYCLGLIGALIYFLQQTEGFWGSIVGILKALVWPAYLIYELLKSLAV